MRIGIRTASYDSREPHWHMQYNYADGKFVEVGGQQVTRWDYRITSVVVSETPRPIVWISGRCTSPGRRWPEFLAIRVGQQAPKYFALSIDSTAFLYIDSKGLLTVRRRKFTRERFEALWSKVMKGQLNSSAFKLAPRILSLADGIEPVAAPNVGPTASSDRSEVGEGPPSVS